MKAEDVFVYQPIQFMKTAFQAVLASLLLAGCEPAVNSQKVIIDMPALANQPPEGTRRILGNPDSTYTLYIAGREIPVDYYHKKGLEIQYWGGKATDIVVQNPMPLPFAPSTLGAFGISPSEPTAQSKNVTMKWDDKPAFKMINFYAVDYDQNNRVSRYRIFFKAK